MDHKRLTWRPLRRVSVKDELPKNKTQRYHPVASPAVRIVATSAAGKYKSSSFAYAAAAATAAAYPMPLPILM